MKKVNLLWTGGFDSTFRLCQLSRMNGVVVQPVYFRFKTTRKNEYREMEAQDKILPLLLARPETKATIFAPIRFHEDDLPEDPETDKAYERLNALPGSKIPGQNKRLAKLALVFPGIEIGREGPTLKHRQEGMKYGNTRSWLMQQGVRFKNTSSGLVIPDFSKATSGLDRLFGRFSYPILNIPETTMATYIREWGYENIFKLVWSCDFSGKTLCGICHNCQTKWDSGLKNFLPPEAVRNHEIKEFLEKQVTKNKFLPLSSYNKARAVKSFEDFVHNDYKIIPPNNGPVNYALPLQKLLYDSLLKHDVELENYFNSLIDEWDMKYAASN